MTQQVADDDLSALRAQRDRANAKVAEVAKTATDLASDNEKLNKLLGQERANRVQADELAAANALAAAETVASQAEAAIEAALKAGDGAALAKAQRALSNAQYDIRTWESQKARIENWKKVQVARIATEATEATKAPPAQQAAYTPKTQAWLDAHPDVANDPKRLAKATAYHIEAIADGLEPESPEYFAFVEQRLGLKAKEAAPEPKEDGDVDVTDEEKPEKKEADASSEAIPPQRKTPSTSGSKLPAGKMRLTAAEVEAAQFSFPDLKKEEALKAYAQNKAKLQQEGRMAS